MENEQIEKIIDEVLQTKPMASLSVDFSKKVQFKVQRALLLKTYLLNFLEILLATVIVIVSIALITFLVNSKIFNDILTMVKDYHAVASFLIFCAVFILFIDKVVLKFATFLYYKNSVE